MSTINLKLEKIKDEDFIDDEESSYENLIDSSTNIAECGRVFLDLEMKTLSFCCFFCREVFQEVYDLVEHVTDTHILESREDSEDFLELEPTINCNSLEITALPEEYKASNEPTESFNEINLNQSTDTFTSSIVDTLHKSELCDETFQKESDLQEYLAISIGELPFKCNQCSKAFRTEEILHYHSAVHSGSENNFKCTHCDQLFVKKRYLQMHLNYLFDEKSFPCTVCGKQNRTAHQLKTHMVKHSSKKEHVCEICGSSYRLRHHLVTHQIQTHENKREFACNICDRAFNTLAFLNTHKISHSKERKHICNICGTGFVWKKNLIEHGKLHSDIKNYKCEICGKGFSQRSGLITHIKNHVATTTY